MSDAAIKAKTGCTCWWSQTVTVGYERIKGLRAMGQRRDGVPLARLADRAAAARMKGFWAERLSALGEVLTG